MDTRKIGEFLKRLRKEKGLTQEQLAEILLVSGRTVSRWETGTNMPDLSILIQIAEFYDVDVKEILDGERKGELVNQEMKETLSKVADYNKLEKEKAARVGNMAFIITFAVCVAAVIVQLLMGKELTTVMGETIAMVVGGVAYIGIMLYNGLDAPSSPVKEVLTGILCSAGSSVVFYFRSVHLGAAPSRAMQGALCFFVFITILGFALMKGLTLINRKRKGGGKA